MHRTRLAVLALVALVAFVAGCTSGGREGGSAQRPAGPTTTPAPSAAPPGKVVFSGIAPDDSALAKAPALATLYGDGFDERNGFARVDVLALERTTPEAVTLRFRIASDGRAGITVALSRAGVASLVYDNIDAVAGMFLLDPDRRSLYLPMKRSPGEVRAPCLCSYIDAIFTKLEPGGPPALAYAVYQVPAGVTSLAVGSEQLGLTQTLPITAAGPDTLRLGDEPAPAVISKAFPLTVGLATYSAGKVQAVDESASQVQIALNTDVLFAFDKAALTPVARTELRRVAARLRTEASGTVRVVGHTDDVGSDRYNLDLSRRRAEAVRRALAGTRLTFQVQGKGETQPAASGTSAAARARNRRVEVTFERVQQPAPPPTTAPAPTATAAPTPEGPPSAASPIGTGRGVREFEGITLEVLQLRRANSFGLLLEVRLRNTGNGPGSLDRVSNDPDADRLTNVFRGVGWGYNGEFYWPVLTDAGGTRYYAVAENRNVPRSCVCSFHRFANVGPDREIRLFAVMTAPPAGTRQVNVEAPGFTPVRNLPVTG
jgi:outer membrane protein OmpA-like peptidoglycan-associated protein